jgi:hypothetical protein
MDRQGYEGTGYQTGTAGGYQSNTAGKPLGQTIKEHLPGTNEYQAIHGTTPAHSAVNNMKTYVPGTEEHRMARAGVTSHAHDTAGQGIGSGMGTGYTGTGTGMGSGYTGTGTGYTGTGGPTMGERVKQAIPGTNEYEATHGMTGAHRTVEQAKAHVPGTDEHRIHEGTRPVGAGTGMGTMGTGGYSDTGYGAGTGMGNTGYGAGTGMGTTGTGDDYVEGGKKPLGQKIKEVIPGTREHEAKKIEQGRF